MTASQVVSHFCGGGSRGKSCAPQSRGGSIPHEVSPPRSQSRSPGRLQGLLDDDVPPGTRPPPLFTVVVEIPPSRRPDRSCRCRRDFGVRRGAPRSTAGIVGPQRETGMDADRRPRPRLPRRLPPPRLTRAAASVSPPSPSPTSGNAASVVLNYRSEVSGASTAAPPRLPIRDFVAQVCAERPRKRRGRPLPRSSRGRL